MTLLVGLDIGTTAIKAVLYDLDIGKIIRIASQPTPVNHPRPEWSEHDPQAIWDVTAACIREVANGRPVTALAISSMAEAGVFVDKNGQALAPIIAWYDRRSEPQVAWIEEHITSADLFLVTGQRVSPSFGVTKMLWTRDAMPEVFSAAAIWLPVPSFLMSLLTGQFMVDYSIASRTLLFDQSTLSWSHALMDLFRLTPSLLPVVAPGGTPVGRISKKAAQQTGLPETTLCVLGGHDHLCAALSTGAYRDGTFVDSTGSANALLMLSKSFIANPALAERGFASYAYVLQEFYALKGGLKTAGSALDWLAHQFSPPGTVPDYISLEAAAQAGIGKRAGPIWLPHLIGSGTPQGDRFSRAAVAGLRFEHNNSDLFRGMLESLAFWTRQNLEEMEMLANQKVAAITLTGGITRLRLLSQLKSTMTNRPALIPDIPEAAAAGAALLAGLGSGTFTSPEDAVSSLRYKIETIEPQTSLTDWYETLYQTCYLPLYDALKNINLALESQQTRYP